MKILHVRASEFFGGPERAIIGQCLNLKSMEFECASFIRGPGENQFLDECKSQSIKTHIIKESFLGDLRAIGQIRRLIIKNQYDLVVTHDTKSNFCVYYAISKTKAGQITHFRGRTSEYLKTKI